MPYVIEDQVSVTMSVGDVFDAVPDEQSLEELVVTETAGGAFPVMKAVLRTANDDLLRAAREESEVYITLGDSRAGRDEVWGFVPQKTRLAKSGDQFWILEINGIDQDLPNWLRAPRSRGAEISEPMSGVARIIEVAGRSSQYRGVDSNVQSSADEQRWIQYGCPNRVHVNDVWMHCDLPGSFPALAHTLVGFRLRDVAKAVAGPVGWTFSNSGGDGRTVPYDIILSSSSSSGLFNALGARGQYMHWHDLDSGEAGIAESEPAGLLTGTEDVDRGGHSIGGFAPVPLRRSPISRRNVHEKYWDSYLNNRTMLALHSSTSLELSWRGDYRPVRPLDVCRFSDKDVQSRERLDVDHSGYYLVSRVSRSFRDGTFQTTVQLVREALSVR